MPRWIVTIGINVDEYEEEIEVWADHVRQRDSRTVLADSVMLVFAGPLIKPPQLQDS